MDKLFKQVSNIVDLLVLRKFNELESITEGVRLSAPQLEEAVNGYGRTLVKLPPKSIGLIDIVKVNSRGADKWYIVSPLWTIAWLRKKRVTAQKPLYTLRKEMGRILAEKYGIYAASKRLRHADLSVTVRHYADDQRLLPTGLEGIVGGGVDSKREG